MTALDEAPPMIYLSLSDNSILFDQFLTLSQSQNRYGYALRGVTYFVDKHFTARLIKPDGHVWYNDGIKTGSKPMTPGLIARAREEIFNSKLRDGPTREAVGLVYSRVDV